MNEAKQIPIGELFTRDELTRAFKIIGEYRTMSQLALEMDVPIPPLNEGLKTHVVTPEVMDRIDRQTAQKNDPNYFCYALQYAHTMTQGKVQTLAALTGASA